MYASMMRGTFIILVFAVGTWISSAHARALIGTNPRDQSMRIIIFGRSSTSAAILSHQTTVDDPSCTESSPLPPSKSPPLPPFTPPPPDPGPSPRPSPRPTTYHGIVTGGGSLRVSNVASF
ncbi:verprolin-like [Prunus avium]|uniref:Verprolin-like n=1 Tax=Prunus avium TaxID=42229 RepID=A0A6P5U356_PRUAV|nr:verprolin-like [Prunus avium]